MLNATLIANPAAGGGRPRRWRDAILAHATERFGDVSPQWTEGPGHATELAREAVRDGVPWVVAVGGDGTLSEVAQGFLNNDGQPTPTQSCFVPLPGGTGNDLTRTLGLAAWTPAQGCPWEHAEPQAMDVGVVAFDAGPTRAFVNIASCGITLAVAELLTAEAKGRGGALTYALGTLRAVMNFTPPTLRIRADDGPWQPLNPSLLAVANASTFAGGMQVAPGASIRDGTLQVVVVNGKRTLLDVLRAFPNLYRGRRVTLPGVSYQTVRTLRIEPVRETPVFMELDGEIAQPLPATFTVHPKALRVLAPR